jgi:4-diphosphocytidyl-2-C-methyl-D-erythritol kinase
LASGDVRRLAAALHNDLEQAACDLRPDLARLIVEGVDAGALRGLVSGSGPTCVFLCESGAHARTVAGALTAAEERRVALVAHGPVAGAHVVTDG